MTDSLKFPTPAPPQLRYAVLRHEGVAEPHFDLMFETTPGSALSTWRSPAWPLSTRTALLKLADHRRAYLTFEGPLTGDRGHVFRVAAGFYRLERPTTDLWQLTFKDFVGFTQVELSRDPAPVPVVAVGGVVSDEATVAEPEAWTARPLAG